MSDVFLHKAPCNVNEFLRIAIGVRDFHLNAAAHQFNKTCKQADIRTGKSKYRLPVITDRNDFGAGYLTQPLGQIKALPGDILEFINNDVFIGQFQLLPLNFGKIKMGIVNHVLKINTVLYGKLLLIIMINRFRNIQEKMCARIVGFCP